MKLSVTNTCFDDALDYFTELRNNGVPREVEAEHYIIHAICLDPATKQRIAHAWVVHEPTQAAIFAMRVEGGPGKIYLPIKRETYEETFQPQFMTRYTLPHALLLNMLHDNFGPWEPEYRALVGGICKVCGCTQDAACEGGCAWADGSMQLCTRCAGIEL